MGTGPSKFLFKANDDVLSFCGCVDAPAMSTGQLDCPWCGCGWLISCSECGKAFTFAEVRETEVPLIELGWREAKSRGLNHVSDDDVEAWAAGMAEALEGFEIGQVIVYLDGEYWPVVSTDIAFDGYFASHRLDRLPHTMALAEPAMLNALLGNPKYWFDRERSDREVD